MSVFAGDPNNLTPRVATGVRDRNPAKLDSDVSGRTRPSQTRWRAVLTPAPIGPKPRHVHGYAVPLSVGERRGDTISNVRVATGYAYGRIVRAHLKRARSNRAGCHDDRYPGRS
jgi:hypothetical protein